MEKVSNNNFSYKYRPGQTKKEFFIFIPQIKQIPNMPSNQTVKIVYKGADNNEFFIIANSAEVAKYKTDKTIPLVEVVQSFDVFTTNTGGNTGEAVHPPKGLLESSFNTSNKDEIVKVILEKGEEKAYNKTAAAGGVHYGPK